MAKDDINPRDLDDTGIVPASYRVVGPHAQDAGAREVIANNAPEINSFISKNREAIHTSSLAQHKASTSTDDLDITYHHQFGQERIELTPYVTVPPEPVEPTSEEPEPVTPEYPLPDFPEPELTDRCLLVLYKEQYCAAFSMATLRANAMAPIFQKKVPKSSFTGQIVTGQFAFGGVGFIQTDVDLSGKEKKKSILCTTDLRDAISMDAQVTPIMNSPSAIDGTDATIYVYTTVGSFAYDTDMRKLTLNTPVALPQKPCAIDSRGNYFYAPSFNTVSLVTLKMQDMDGEIDGTLLAKEVATKQEGDAIWVFFHEFGVVNSQDFHGTNEFQTIPNPTNLPFNGVNYWLFPGQHNEKAKIEFKYRLIVGAITLPSLAPAPHQNMNDITDYLGTSYYGRAHLGDDKMVIADLAIAFTTLPYFEYSLETNYYETFQYAGQGGGNSDFSGNFPRMTYNKQRGVAYKLDPVAASAVCTREIITTAEQGFPDFGGQYYIGRTKDQPTYVSGGFFQSPTFTNSATPVDNYYSATYFAPCPIDPDIPGADQRLALATTGGQKELTIISTMPVPPDYNFDNGVPTYEQMVHILAELEGYMTSKPDGPKDNHTNSYGAASLYEVDTNLTRFISGVKPYYGYTETTSQNVTDEPGSINVHPPGYKVQNVKSNYTFQLDWLDQHLDGTSDGTNITRAGITVLPFPPSIDDKPYYSIGTQQPNGNTNKIVTPYQTFSQGELKPWLHVSNKDHYIQGYLINDAPHLYLDGNNMLPALMKALKCAATDINALYMDIRLTDIQALTTIR